MIGEAAVTVIVACRTADGTLVLGADGQLTSEDGNREINKLTFFPFQDGMALMGMAARNVSLGYMRKADLFCALRAISSGQDPVEVIQKRMAQTSENPKNNVQILCAITSSAIESPRLLGICDTEAIDMDVSRLCCIGGGDEAAHSFLNQTIDRIQNLREAQVAVCASVWLAKQADDLCGEHTDIWWLRPDQSMDKLEAGCIESWEEYFKTSPPDPQPGWMEGVP